MLTALSKFPAPYFGGKRHAAPLIWEALGDPAHYVEPFAGTCAVLLERPHLCNRPYVSETVGDADGLLVNALRSLAWHPQATAEAASWYVAEADLTARHLALVTWVQTQPLDRLMADPYWCDPEKAGWWLWGLSCWIGSGWCSGQGPWGMNPETGRLERRRGTGVWQQRPHLSNNGQGVNRPGTRESGVSQQRPHLTNGQGVNHPGTREPGVTQQLPHLSNNGRGVNHAGTREPGVWQQLPHLSSNGQGVNHAGTREPGIEGRSFPADVPPDVDAAIAADYAATEGYHPRTMPELRRWFAALAARLRHVRIVHGDWRRLTTNGALKTLQVRQEKGSCGVFLDPPYTPTERDPTLYRMDEAPSTACAAEVRDWCLAHGDDPQLRIVLAGFAGEGHEILEAHGWRCLPWFQVGHLRGGMGHTNQTGTHQQDRERLWLSPHCYGKAEATRQLGLWGTA